MTNRIHSEHHETHGESSELELAEGSHDGAEPADDEDDHPTLTFIDAAKLNEELTPLTPPSPA